MSQFSPTSPNVESEFVTHCRTEAECIEMGIDQLVDIEIIRFYQAAHGDVIRAVHDLKELLNWRKLVNYQDILNRDYPDYCKSLIYFYDLSQNGHPILFYKAKNHLPLTDDIEMLVNYSISLIGNLQKNHNYSKVYLLFDRDGATKDNVNLALAKQTISLFTKYFPETLKELLVFPSNFLLWSLWSIIKPFMDPDTVQKVFLIDLGVDIE
eukprot:NODE_554_length_6117_cov_0.778498.p2 type:complete len:210 gc:universal NODE_554_length_6117_cov_0.778498:3986-4615(+)